MTYNAADVSALADQIVTATRNAHKAKKRGKAAAVRAELAIVWAAVQTATQLGAREALAVELKARRFGEADLNL